MTQVEIDRELDALYAALPSGMQCKPGCHADRPLFAEAAT